MKINYAKVIQVEKWIEIRVKYKGEVIDFNVKTIGGVVQGDLENGLMTSTLRYFHNTPPNIQNKHWIQIKKYVEVNIFD